MQFKNNDNPCAICLDEVNTMNYCRLNGCQHLFHCDCIESMIKTTENYNKCPLCRNEFTKIQKHIINESKNNTNNNNKSNIDILSEKCDVNDYERESHNNFDIEFFDEFDEVFIPINNDDIKYDPVLELEYHDDEWSYPLMGNENFVFEDLLLEQFDDNYDIHQPRIRNHINIHEEFEFDSNDDINNHINDINNIIQLPNNENVISPPPNNINIINNNIDLGIWLNYDDEI